MGDAGGVIAIWGTQNASRCRVRDLPLPKLQHPLAFFSLDICPSTRKDTKGMPLWITEP
jgi:hypothetical protein